MEVPCCGVRGTTWFNFWKVSSVYLFRLFIFFSLLRNPSSRKGEGEVRGVRSRLPVSSPSGLKRPTPLSRQFSFFLELFQFVKTNPGVTCACNYFSLNLNFAKVYLHKSTSYFDIKMYKYCQQDSINLLKMNFRKYQKLK